MDPPRGNWPRPGGKPPTGVSPWPQFLTPGNALGTLLFAPPRAPIGFFLFLLAPRGAQGDQNQLAKAPPPWESGEETGAPLVFPGQSPWDTTGPRNLLSFSKSCPQGPKAKGRFPWIPNLGWFPPQILGRPWAGQPGQPWPVLFPGPWTIGPCRPGSPFLPGHGSRVGGSYGSFDALSPQAMEEMGLTDLVSSTVAALPRPSGPGPPCAPAAVCS